MHVAELWRYPVKSLAGERLEQAEIRRDGLAGDRLVQVYDARGHVVTARKHPDLLGHRGTLGSDGEPRIDGWPWPSAEAAARISEALGWKPRLERFAGEERFDVLPLLVANVLPAGNLFEDKQAVFITGIEKVRRLRIMRSAHYVALQLFPQNPRVAPLDASRHRLTDKRKCLVTI